jgi:hypothetical protein
MNNSGGSNTAYGAANRGLSPKHSNASNGNTKPNNHTTKPGVTSVNNFQSSGSNASG